MVSACREHVKWQSPFLLNHRPPPTNFLSSNDLKGQLNALQVAYQSKSCLLVASILNIVLKLVVKASGSIFASSLWLKGHILIMRCVCVGQGPLSSQPPFRSPVRDDGVCWATSLSPLLAVYSRRGGSVQGLAGCMAGRGWGPSTAFLGSHWAEVRAGLWGCPAGPSGGSWLLG